MATAGGRLSRYRAIARQRPGIREQVVKDLDALDEIAGLIDGFQKVANRIALGLVLAAAGGGCYTAWTILAGDVRARH